MEMNKEDEIALEESISDWKDNYYRYKKHGKVSYYKKECPLCKLGKEKLKEGYMDGSGYCFYCIIKKHTGRSMCYSTPFHSQITGTLEWYEQEITFLESLRPKKKVEKDVIEIGDEVNIIDYSFAYGLNRGKKIPIHSMNTTLYHIVVEVGVCLPEGDTKKTFGNNTIIYDNTYGNYIFTREKYLRLVKPKHCPECGKAK